MSVVPPSPPCATTRTSVRPRIRIAAATPEATAAALPNSEWIHGICHEVSGYGVENTSRQPVALTAITWLPAARIAAALKVKGRSEVRVVAQGGDGGTTDIGFGCLSGMFERNDDVLYICYDNEAYMNTGVQRSSATPPAARTTTTMPVGAHPGNEFGQGKYLPAIAMAHEIPYVATATVADLRDLEAKVKRAMEFRGARYIHIFVPCPLGWGTASHDTIRIARLAHETGLFPIFEAEHGVQVSALPIRKQLPVEEYLKPQKRFAHLFGAQPKLDVIAQIQARADRNIRRYGLVQQQELL